MAHIIVEYSANLEGRGQSDRREVEPLEPRVLLDRLCRTAVETGWLPLAGLRARTHRTECYQVADGADDGAFVHVQLRIGPDRTVKQQQQIADLMFDTVKQFFISHSEKRPLALSLELVNLGIRHNHNNLRKYLGARS